MGEVCREKSPARGAGQFQYMPHTAGLCLYGGWMRNVSALGNLPVDRTADVWYNVGESEKNPEKRGDME